MSPCLYVEYSSLLPLWFHLSTFSFIHMIMDEMGCMLSHLELSKQNGAQVPPPEILVYWEEDWRSWEGFPGGLSGNKSTCQCKRRGFNPWVGKIPWQRKWQPTPVFLPGEFHGQRSPVGSMGSPWGHKESDTTEWQHTQRGWEWVILMVQSIADLHTLLCFSQTNTSGGPCHLNM